MTAHSPEIETSCAVIDRAYKENIARFEITGSNALLVTFPKQAQSGMLERVEESMMRSTQRRVNLYAGWLLILAFVLTGQYMRYVIHPAMEASDRLRFSLRGNHIYILLIGLQHFSGPLNTFLNRSQYARTFLSVLRQQTCGPDATLCWKLRSQNRARGIISTIFKGGVAWPFTVPAVCFCFRQQLRSPRTI